MPNRFAVGVPEGSPVFEVDGVRLAVAREGSGPPLVCLHAVGHGGGDFAAIAAALRDRFEVIRVDWPGQGRSEPDHRPASAQRYGELLSILLPRLGVESPVIIGNSIGGAAALVFAVAHPVRSLVLCDSGGLLAVNGMVRTFCGLLARLFEAGRRGAWWFRPAFAAYCRMVLPAPAAAAQRRRIVAASYETAAVLAEAWRSFGQPEADLRALAASIEAPVWAAWAESDRVIPLSLCREALRAMKSVTTDTFSGGHAAFLEAPDEFLRGLEQHLARIGPGLAREARGPGSAEH